MGQSPSYPAQTPTSATANALDRAARSDAGLYNSAKTLHSNARYQSTRNVRTAMRREMNDSDRAYFCLFCDRSFESTNALQEHLVLHDPAYQNVLDTSRREDPRSRSVETHRDTDLYSFCRVCNKDFKFQPEKLLKHHDLAVRHRNVQSRYQLHPTTDRPELWCALCETRFTHTDRKLKHMEEINHHNTRFVELQEQARRDPADFDWSILEPPKLPQTASVPTVTHVTPSPSATADAAGRSQRSRRVRTQTQNSNARSGTVTEDESESVHYCSACDRCFLSATELQLHQSDSEEHRNAIAHSQQLRLPPSPSPPTNPISPTLPFATQSMSNLSVPVAPRSPPPSPPPAYEDSLLTPPVHTRGPRNARSSTELQSERVASTAPTAPTFECALCLEREDNLSSLACGHIFGTDCIRGTLRDDLRCPICRKPAAVNDLRRVFLS